MTDDLEELEELADPPLRPGQVWTYRTRAGEDSSRAVIFKVERDDRHGTLAHVALEGLQVRNPNVPGGVSTGIAHLPYRADVLRDSLIELESTREGTPDLAGYHTWKASYDRGVAGLWGASLTDAIDSIEAALAR
jgi:hypothetical protein